MSERRYSHAIHTEVTEEMNRLLEDLAHKRTRNSTGKATSKAHIVREAIRFYLDHQDDLYGSRKQMVKAIDTRLDSLNEEIEALRSQLEQLGQDLEPLVSWVKTRQGGR
jgi:hypothetical protein